MLEIVDIFFGPALCICSSTSGTLRGPLKALSNQLLKTLKKEDKRMVVQIKILESINYSTLRPCFCGCLGLRS